MRRKISPLLLEMTDKVETVSARTTGYVGSEELSRNLTKREIVPNELGRNLIFLSFISAHGLPRTRIRGRNPGLLHFGTNEPDAGRSLS